MKSFKIKNRHKDHTCRVNPINPNKSYYGWTSFIRQIME